MIGSKSHVCVCVSTNPTPSPQPSEFCNIRPPHPVLLTMTALLLLLLLVMMVDIVMSSAVVVVVVMVVREVWWGGAWDVAENLLLAFSDVPLATALVSESMWRHTHTLLNDFLHSPSPPLSLPLQHSADLQPSPPDTIPSGFFYPALWHNKVPTANMLCLTSGESHAAAVVCMCVFACLFVCLPEWDRE